jgi:hypothetical protein
MQNTHKRHFVYIATQYYLTQTKMPGQQAGHQKIEAI